MATYNEAKDKIAKGELSLGTDSLKIALFTSSYIPNIDTDLNFSDISANEISGTGYTAGGNAIANVLVQKDLVNDRVDLPADNSVFTAATLTFKIAVIYKDTGNPATSTLVSFNDFGTDQTIVAGDLTLNLSTGFARFS